MGSRTADLFSQEGTKEKENVPTSALSEFSCKINLICRVRSVSSVQSMVKNSWSHSRLR
jgi:hypothetical protein